MQTKQDNLIKVVEILANEFNEQERTAILNMNFTELKGLSGEQLKNRVSKTDWRLVL